jgi:formamidopyrimidine-DNA glycosylase
MCHTISINGIDVRQSPLKFILIEKITISKMLPNCNFFETGIKMPELPEVETVCQSLKKHLLGKVVSQVNVYNSSLRRKVDEVALNDACRNRPIKNLWRRAKYILVDLGDNNGLILHLGMTGKFRIVTSATSLKKHEHVSFELSNGESWRFEDPRRFGMIEPVQLTQLPKAILALGPEPLEENFTGKYLFDISRNKTKPIKNFIMDGGNVVGVGNIYASEALHRCGISPLRATEKLKKTEAESLVNEIQKVLTEAIAAGGTTINDFATPDGSEGYFFRELTVYGRENKPCFSCENPIIRIVQAGRSSFYCNKCQK